ncbi:MAG: phosphatidate cytidylyltransferase [Bacteroidales bacterium]|nr:phosphatidate cytidylyltransferase [Bacteroidales bacterium]
MSSSLKVRTLSGIVFVVVMVCGLILNRYVFAALVAFMIVSMMMEFYHMTFGRQKHIVPKALMMTAGVVLFCLMFIAEATGAQTRYLPVSMILVMASMAAMLFEKDKSSFTDFAYIATGFLYIAVPLCLSTIIAFKSGVFDGTLLLCFFIIIWCSDIGAYALGMAFGQREGSRKLCPEISPKKSWTGFWGGLLLSVIAACTLHWVGLLIVPLVHCIALGILMSLGGLAGDLFESMWKRSFGLKDSGQAIPGHGGLLDRFDSTLIAMPLGAIYLSLFNLL